MTEKEKDLVTRISGLVRDITIYIKSNPDWIYYFLNPLAGGNEELFDCIREHPDDWEDYIDFEIANALSSVIQIKIHIDDYTDYGLVFPRYINLLNFEETVERNKMLYDGKMDEIRKEGIKEDIARLKEELQKKEEELKKLEK
jgi:hypothetical protein